MSTPRPDRLRQLLDAVLDEDNVKLGQMASGAFTTEAHFNRQVSRAAGEPPVAMRRRVLLERAAWQLQGGASVTEVAFAAGYESVEGFSRAFQRAYRRPPSTPASSADHWLPAPNGIHFHPPMSLWVRQSASGTHAVFEQLVQHDLDDTDALLAQVAAIPDEIYHRPLVPGLMVLQWDGVEETLAQVLTHLVLAKQVWLASIHGEDRPDHTTATATELQHRHRAVAPRWLATVRDLDARAAWDDRLIDALCEPPESFVLSSVISHVLTFAAARRQLARIMLRAFGCPTDHGDPITWWQTRLTAR